MGLFICILIFHLFNHAEIPCLTFLWCYTGMCNWYAVLYSVVVIRSRWREVTLSAGISMVHTSDRGFSFENQPSSLSLGEISAVSKPASRVGTAYSINWSEMQAFDNKLIDKLTMFICANCKICQFDQFYWTDLEFPLIIQNIWVFIHLISMRSCNGKCYFGPVCRI